MKLKKLLTAAVMPIVGAHQYAYDKTIDAMNPDVPAPAVLPTAFSPTSDDPAVKARTEANLAAALEDQRKARGRASTIIAGGPGGMQNSGSITRRTLMGV